MHFAMEDPAHKKYAIFESTLRLVRDHGFHGAPMSLVAKNAGVAAGTIYHYFASKEQLICELYDYNRTRMLSVIDSSIKEESTYRENFLNIWTGLYKFYVHEPNVLIFFEQFLNSPFNVSKHPNFSRGQLYSFFSEGVKKGILKRLKPEILLVLMMGSVSSTAKLNLFGKVPLTRQDLERIAGISWDGLVSDEWKNDSRNALK
ncbi:MAG: TetR/AcrR family transcriptional regulator [Bacteroidota bacterium]|nr:TetR/AcrR family transcriptional regulator [Bacteroidota bacterium]